MKQLYKWPKYMKHNPTHYCPGCGHGVVHRIIAELLEEMNLGDKTFGVAPAGCAVLAYNYLDFDIVEAPHGRGAAVATGIKRCLPDRLVLSYQGDGDLAAIGTAETIHAANRGEHVTCIFINNANYGMTGGQMAPTTLLSQVTTTTPGGRDSNVHGFPMHISDLVAMLPGTAYVERVAIESPKGIRSVKRAIRNAFEAQMNNEGFSLIEILSPCPTNWKKTPEASWEWIKEVLSEEFPPGVLADRRLKKPKKSKKSKKGGKNAD